MANAHMPEEFFAAVAHHLPPERPVGPRLRVRYDRLGVIIDAWATLAASVICFRMLYHDAA